MLLLDESIALVKQSLRNELFNALRSPIQSWMVAYLRTFLSECFLTICPVFGGVRRPQNDLKASGNYAYGDSSLSK